MNRALDDMVIKYRVYSGDELTRLRKEVYDAMPMPHGWPVSVNTGVDMMSSKDKERFMKAVLNEWEWERWTDPVQLFVPDISVSEVIKMLENASCYRLLDTFIGDMANNPIFARAVWRELYRDGEPDGVLLAETLRGYACRWINDKISNLSMSLAAALVGCDLCGNH